MKFTKNIRLLAKFNCNPAVDDAAVPKFEVVAGLNLPDKYIQFLKHANGGEGFIGKAYLILWPVEQLIEMNDAYQVAEYAPGLFLFGSDGGGEAFAFDVRLEEAPIVSIPFVGMELHLVRAVASDFQEFLEKLYDA